MNRPVPVHKLEFATLAPPAETPAVEESLYEVREKIYPRALHGWFAGWRWGTVWATQLVFYGTAWLEWNGRQAVLFDLAARKFYIFGLVLWPQDFIYLTALLVISALSLFLFTAVAGRLFCGYACPQTVYTEIFLWIERRIEGDRSAQMKLDRQPLSAKKFGLKAAKHAVWFALALWTGFTFVGYFTPIRDLVAEVAGLNLGPWETFWVLFYGFATYGNAGWMREQVCKYMCPYARFQSAMFDGDTLIITYDEARGEPRGSRPRNVDPASRGLGACVDCNICVQVCPTGIDIRKGLQYECIGCAACIDGCNQVMDKMGYPQGLIRYSTENALQNRLDHRAIVQRVFRPRVLVYSGILLAIGVVASAALWLRLPLKVDVIRDRGVLAREVEGGQIENVYRLQIMNTDEVPHAFEITAGGLPGIAVVGADRVEMAGATARGIPIRLRVPADAGKKGANRIQFTVRAADNPALSVTEKASFVRP
jgi:cytochrome c oxidase accessory protein FixG